MSPLFSKIKTTGTLTLCPSTILARTGNDWSWKYSYLYIFLFLPMDSTCSYCSLSFSLYNPSYPGAGPTQESKGVTIHRWRHQVHAHCPPAPAVPLGSVETSLNLAALQPQDQETLCKVVHGLKLEAGKLWYIKGGGLVITVEQNALVKREK